jgi:hypothetical protein
VQIQVDIPETRSSGLPARRTRLPARYQDAAPIPLPRRRIRHPVDVDDDLPADPPPLVSFSESSVGLSDATPLASQESDASSSSQDLSFRTLSDRFGVYRVYPAGKPPYSPDETYILSDVVNSVNIATEPSTTSRPWFAPYASSIESLETTLQHTPYAPFLNMSVYLLMSWYYNYSKIKSQGELDRLVNEVILAPEFSKDDLIGFRAAKEMKRMDEYHHSVGKDADTQAPSGFDDQWIETSVFIPLPCDGVQHASEADAPTFEVKGLFYRRITEVIKAALAEPAAEKFHLFPFKMYWKPTPDAPEERIYSEAYTADYFIEEYEKVRLQSRPAEKAHLIPVIIGMMIYSDATHLANFGTASVWPIYLYFGNQSKYERAKPSSFAAHHLAYLPKVCFLHSSVIRCSRTM